jgi:hypothetical protein
VNHCCEQCTQASAQAEQGASLTGNRDSHGDVDKSRMQVTFFMLVYTPSDCHG